MKRDLTVTLSLIIFFGTLVLGLALGMPRNITEDSPIHFHVFFWIMFAAAIRATVLWFQTLIHAIEYAAEENRVAAVMAHLLLGPIMSYPYYFAIRPGAAQRRHAEST